MSPPSSSAGTATGRGSTALILLFFVSGAASLVYEAVWNRLLVLQMGNTAYTLTTILTVFMGGLALGSFIGGRFASSLRDPLRVYGWLELGIGLYCAAVPWMIRALEPLMQLVYNGWFQSFATFSFFQFLACGAVLLLPVTAMGATLPIVTDFVARRSGAVATSVGVAYGINTLGGFVGVMVGGLVLVPALGLMRANGIAACLSATAGLLALAFSARLGRPAERPQAVASRAAGPSAEADADTSLPVPPLLLALAASGFAAMTYQVAWTRVITLSIGSVTYSFPLIVGAFIAGLAVGAAVIGRLGDRPGWATPLLIGCQFGIGLLAATTIPALGDLPIRMTLTVLRYSDSFEALQLAKFAAVFAIVFAPTFLMGGMLPLAARALAARTRGGVGGAVGRAYASNTLGTIVGAFVAGFVLIPTIGMQSSIAFGVAVNAFAGSALLVCSESMSAAARIAAAVLLAVVIPVGAFLSPDWDRQVLTSAPYLHAPLYAEDPSAGEEAVRASLARRARIVYYREDVATTVTVLDDASHRYLYVGGKLDALSRSSSQALLGHLPMLLHPAPEKVLVVGLGSSETLASTLRYRSAREVDCIEISPAVVEAARNFFQLDRNPLIDPRVSLRIGDGRVHMSMTDDRYDVIISQPGNPWMAGASALFTREYFEQMKERLRPGGVVSVWVQSFSASPESVHALIGTFVSVFENADLWESRTLGDYILTGYLEPRDFDLAAIEAQLREPSVASGLRIYEIEDAADVLGYFTASGRAVRSLPGADRINRDDHNFVEARLQRELMNRREVEVRAGIAQVREDPLARLRPEGGGPGVDALVERLERIVRSKTLVDQALASREREQRLADEGDVVAALAERRRYERLIADLRELNPRDALLRGAR